MERVEPLILLELELTSKLLLADLSSQFCFTTIMADYEANPCLEC